MNPVHLLKKQTYLRREMPMLITLCLCRHFHRGPRHPFSLLSTESTPRFLSPLMYGYCI
ncbi:Acetoacetyl-CoA synthetase, partial [Fusarium oxysporum f. sp. albedinis]